MKSRTPVRLLAVALVTALILPLLATPALAVGRGPVPYHAYAAGIDLFGMSEAQARTIIGYSYPMPYLDPLTVVVEDRTFTFDAGSAFYVDVNGMLAEAYAPHDSAFFDIQPRYAIKPAVVSAWVASIKKAVDTPPVSSRYVAKGRTLVVTPSRAGYGVIASTALTALKSALNQQILAGGGSLGPVLLGKEALVPAVTETTVGKGILVVLSERRVRLYQRGKLLRTYACAIGMPKYPTPVGTFKVVRKVKMPTWTNPGSAWARSMPAFIRPGPSNPLGTRALYLSAQGIRIHGTQKVGSIGTAASHGCVRLRRADVEALFDLVPVGTPVIIVR